MSASKKSQPNLAPTITNRQARYNYHILERFVAGLALHGSEVKSLRQGKVQLQEAFGYFQRGELFVRNLHISPYSQGGYANHTSDRPRKLLLTKRELQKLEKGVKDPGTTIVPLKVFFNDRGFAKLEIGLARGKKSYDKRETIKERETTRKIKRDLGV